MCFVELVLPFLIFILPKNKIMTDKIKIQLEYVINCSPKVLYNRLSTASGLSEWFADDVRIKGKQFTFIWEGSSQSAEMTLHKENKLVRFVWLEEDEGYFEFKINLDELTNDVSLIIIDFTDEDEQEETEELWNSQIAELKHILGS
jgi:uncharacterized protein YndB with AHSA1/START domain